MIYHVTCNTDEKYFQHCSAMLCSLLENNKDLIFNIHLLTSGLKPSLVENLDEMVSRYGSSLTIHNMNESKLEGVKIRTQRPLTKAAYYRILLPDVINIGIDKILYLDCDIIVLGSVKELYNLELDNYALAACEDVSPYNSLHRNQLQLSMSDKAFCSGIMMINLKYWREHQAVTKLLEYSKREREVIFLHDQDSLNYVFKNQWFKLPYKWNVTPLSIVPLDSDQRTFDLIEYVLDRRIIHYSSSLKPWFDVWFPERKYYRKYLVGSQLKNPVFIHVPIHQRIFYQLSVMRYYISRYVFPFIPNLLIIILSDIYNIIKAIVFAFFRPCNLDTFLLLQWRKKK